MEQSHKEQIIKSVNAIKTKIKQMRDYEDQTDLTMNRVLKPVTEPLRALMDIGYSEPKNHTDKIYTNRNEAELSHNSSSDSNYEDFEENETSFDETKPHVFMSPLIDRCKESNISVKPLERSLNKDDIEDIYENINIPFGVRKENKQFFMGSEKVNILVSDNPLTSVKKHSIIINDMQYNLTPGLRELLLRKTPDLTLVSAKDQLVYKDILCITNAHKRYYNPNGQIKGDKSIKYREIIKPLFLDTSNNANATGVEENKTGSGLPTLKKYKKNTDLVYWDDPNELIERLKLLIASRDAGNSNHDNEIISIIEELKEASVIK